MFVWKTEPAETWLYYSYGVDGYGKAGRYLFIFVAAAVERGDQPFKNHHTRIVIMADRTGRGGE